MRSLGIQGAVRGKRAKTTISDKATPCPADRVNRRFQAPRPNQLRVSDFTYVSTRQGFVYTALVIDAFARRPIAEQRGWRVSSMAPCVVVGPASCWMRWSRRCTTGAPCGVMA